VELLVHILLLVDTKAPSWKPAASQSFCAQSTCVLASHKHEAVHEQYGFDEVPSEVTGVTGADSMSRMSLTQVFPQPDVVASVMRM
jgi:hypothetical protein